MPFRNLFFLLQSVIPPGQLVYSGRSFSRDWSLCVVMGKRHFITATSMEVTSWIKQDFLSINCRLTGILALVSFDLCGVWMLCREDLSLNPRTHIEEASVVLHTCNSWGAGDRDLGSWVASQLHGTSEVQARKKAPV